MKILKSFDSLNEGFTFKTERSTGRYAAFYPDSHYIKLKGKQVGTIGDKAPYKIRLMVYKADKNEDGNPNCDWKWITLKKESESLNAAKEFLKSAYDSIVEKYKLHTLNESMQEFGEYFRAYSIPKEMREEYLTFKSRLDQNQLESSGWDGDSELFSIKFTLPDPIIKIADMSAFSQKNVMAIESFMKRIGAEDVTDTIKSI